MAADGSRFMDRAGDLIDCVTIDSKINSSNGLTFRCDRQCRHRVPQHVRHVQITASRSQIDFKLTAAGKARLTRSSVIMHKPYSRCLLRLIVDLRLRRLTNLDEPRSVAVIYGSGGPAPTEIASGHRLTVNIKRRDGIYSIHVCT